jgi:hypothetical protein
VLVAVALTVGLVAVPSPSHAAGPEASVVFTEVTSYTAHTGTVTLTGTVTNTGSVPLYTVQVMMWRDAAPITSRAELTAALAKDPHALAGARITDEGSFVTIVPSGGGSWEPGARASFTVTASVGQLGINSSGVYLVGVHVRAATDRSSNYQTYGRGRTFVPVVGHDIRAAPSTTVVWMSSTPSLLRPATATSPALFRDDHLAGELSGRLATLLEAANNETNSYAIDPALYREVAAMAAGYTVRQGQTTVAGTGQAVARDWLAGFERLPAFRGYRLPYGNPDLAAAALAGDAGVLTRTTAALPEVPRVAGLPLVIRAGNGAADDRFLEYVAALRPAAILADTTSGPSAVTSTAGTVIATSAPTNNPGPGPDDPTTAVQRRQRQLAESYAAALDGAGSVRVVATAAGAAGAATTSLAPWQSRTLLGSIRPAGTWTSTLSTGQAAGPLSGAIVAAVSDLAQSVTRYGDLTGDPASAALVAARTLSPALSQDWAGDQAAQAYATDAAGGYADAAAGVRLRVAKKVTMTSRQNQFPVTVANASPTPVVVRVRFTTSNASRLSVPTTDPIKVAAGESVTVNVSPEATTNGEVDVVAQLITDGGFTVGGPEAFVIEATEAGRVAWVIVLGSGAVLLVLTVLRIRQVARTGRGAP